MPIFVYHKIVENNMEMLWLVSYEYCNYDNKLVEEIPYLFRTKASAMKKFQELKETFVAESTKVGKQTFLIDNEMTYLEEYEYSYDYIQVFQIEVED